MQISTTLTPTEGYRAWAPQYDETLNPLLALESRLLPTVIGPAHGLRVLDAGCGTGRWGQFLEASGARVVGMDLSEPMLAAARSKPSYENRLAAADISRLPLRDRSFNLAICSFALSYAPNLGTALRELARVASRVIVSDLHPEAMRRGWKRAFRQQEQIIEISHSIHTLDELDGAAENAGLVRQTRLEACFGEPEREIFRAAGKEGAFVATSEHPALLITSWLA